MDMKILKLGQIQEFRKKRLEINSKLTVDNQNNTQVMSYLKIMIF